MILPIVDTTPRPHTGFLRVDNSSNKNIRKNLLLPVVKDPTFKFQVGSSNRANKVGMASPYNLQDLQNGYMADSYLHRGVNEYFNKILKEGFYLDSKNPDAIAYIMLRFDLMTIATENCWQFPIWQAVHDFIKFGNAFIIKVRWTSNIPVPGVNLLGLGGKRPVGGYYAASPLMMRPVLDEKGAVTGWEHKPAGGGSSKVFKKEEVIHIRHNPQSGGIWGISQLLPVLDDVRALRQCEEMIIQLIYKSLNPLIHHEVPDTTQTGMGRQSDVNATAAAHDVSAVNGYIVTPPGHKLNILGMESKALRAEGYLRLLKQRVFAGLGLSEMIMGEASTSSAGSADSFSAVMHDQVRLYQEELSFYITYYIIREMLMEGGFDPLSDPDSTVVWKFNDVDQDRQIKHEEHALLQYQGNAITFEELRTRLSRTPIVDDSQLYLNRVTIPLAQATAAAAAANSPATSGGSSTNKALQNKVKPKNQHTAPKKATASVTDSYNVLSESVASYVRNCLASGTELDPEEAMSICESNLAELECSIGPISEEDISVFVQATEQAIKDASIEESKTKAISSVHGRFEVFKYRLTTTTTNADVEDSGRITTDDQ